VRKGLLLEFFELAPDQINAGARRIYAYKKKLPAQPHVNRKRNGTELKYFSEVSAGEIGAKLFDDPIK
jgi:hypothetical protein